MSIEIVGLLVQDVVKSRSIIFILMRLHAIESNRSSCILLQFQFTDRGKGEERCDTYKISAKQVKEGLK